MLFDDAATEALMVIVQVPLVPLAGASTHVPPRTASPVPLTAPHVVELGTSLTKAVSVPTLRRLVVANETAVATPACSAEGPVSEETTAVLVAGPVSVIWWRFTAAFADAALPIK